MLRNSAYSWGSVSKTLHWVMVIMICVEVPAGFLMAATYAPTLDDTRISSLHDLLGQTHHTTGFVLLMLFAIRLAWRARNPLPEPPPDVSRLNRRIGRLNHWLLYTLLLLVPLSGWAALSVLADSAEYGKTHIWFFGSDGLMPRILPGLPFDSPWGYGLFATAHRWLLIAGGGVLGLHVSAALWHHLVRSDGILMRMWPGGCTHKID
jgi:cytochrome b561